MGKSDKNQNGSIGQAAKLDKLIKDSMRAIIIGFVLLILFIAGNYAQTAMLKSGQSTTVVQIISIIYELVLILVFAFVAFRMVKINKFAREELLVPIQQASEQMVALKAGDFRKEMTLQIDDSEVGRMAHAIAVMKQNLSNMIAEISAVLEQMGQGKYKIELRQEYNGEFKQIKESFYKIANDLAGVMRTVRDASEQIDSGSKQLASAATDLAEGSTTQATKITDLAHMMKDIYASLEKNSAGAEQSVEISTQAGKTMVEGNGKLQELKAAIAEINHCVSEINSIIGSIQAIASQTNLLALNASIEAARAGEAGKGFAVVADQVKSLAGESAQAAGQITGLIDSTVSAVEKGTLLADETSESMAEVMEGAKNATEMMSKMAEMLRGNVKSMEIITADLNSVSEIVDNNSATSQETAAISEEQQAQVETMVAMMEKFDV